MPEKNRTSSLLAGGVHELRARFLGSSSRLPREKCHGKSAMGKVPWEKCHGNSATGKSNLRTIFPKIQDHKKCLLHIQDATGM